MNGRVELTIVSLLAALAWAAPVAAASGLSVSPVFQEINLSDEDEPVGYPLEITNHTNRLMTLRLEAFDLIAEPTLVGKLLPGTTLPASATADRPHPVPARWLVLSKDLAVIVAGEKETIEVTISDPAHLGPGGHYAVIRLTDAEPTPSSVSDSQLAVQSQLLALVFVRQAGQGEAALTLQDATAAGNWWRLPQSVRLEFANFGNVHTYPRGLVRLLDPWQRPVAEGTINAASQPLLPGSLRLYPVPLRFDRWPMLPGRYRLVIDYRPSERETFEQRVLSHFYIGFVPLSVGVLILLGGLLIVRRRRYAYLKSQNSNPKT